MTPHPSEHGFLYSGGLARYRRPSTGSRFSSSSSSSSTSSCSSSSGPSQRRRRASKYKSDLFPGATPYESNGHGSGSCPWNAVPPPLQQRHSSYDYSASPHHHPYHSHPGHEASTQELQRRQLQTQTTHSNVPEPPKSVTTYRRNPGEVPASTLPPAHFVFQEAPLRRRSDPVLGVVGGATTMTTTETAAAAGQVPYPSLSVLAAAVAASRSNSSPSLGLNTSARSSPRHVGALSSTPSSGLNSPSTTKDETKSSQETLEEEEGDMMMIEETGSKYDCDPERSDGLAPGLVVSKGEEAPQETTPQRVLSPATIFAKSLSTVTTLDPAATKLIDQLRLQKHRRTVHSPPSNSSSRSRSRSSSGPGSNVGSPSSTPSPPSSMAFSIIASSTLF
ncbi:MAG: hypothetical protein J3Q66DRAFT_343156 [Benniella sp.]|nr:MAG: hypothetical protein J3Q66DRAFT_343156 [Benniella sp.]